MKNNEIYRQCMAAVCIAINITGSFIAAGLKLPVYLDSIGTLFMSGVFGMKYGILTGVAGNLINGMSFDVYSFYYIPVQVVTAVTASFVMRSSWGTGWKILPGAAMISVPSSVISAVITSMVFGGITSSGSSYFVLLLRNAGIGLTASCFLVQIFTDYADKLAVMFLAGIVIKKTSRFIISITKE